MSSFFRSQDKEMKVLEQQKNKFKKVSDRVIKNESKRKKCVLAFLFWGFVFFCKDVDWAKEGKETYIFVHAGDDLEAELEDEIEFEVVKNEQEEDEENPEWENQIQEMLDAEDEDKKSGSAKKWINQSCFHTS